MNTSANNCDCGGGGIYDVHTETCPKSATPANEWREETERAEYELFEMVYNWGRMGVVVDWKTKAYQKALTDLLTTHSAHLVERLKKELVTECMKDSPASHANHAFLKAIDIVNDNK